MIDQPKFAASSLQPQFRLGLFFRRRWTQIARPSLKRIEKRLENNANHEGAFATSRQSDASWSSARRHGGPLNAKSGAGSSSRQYDQPGRTSAAAGANGSRAIDRVTRLDHDANISPWVLAAEDRGVRVRWVDFHPEDGTLDLEDLRKALEEKPRLVAVGYASNALGTINPVEKIIRWSHERELGTSMPCRYAHTAMDVQSLDCDFLVCSSYKFLARTRASCTGKWST
jgi:hypothetical protein